MGTPRSKEYSAVKKHSHNIYELLDVSGDVTWFGLQLEHELFISEIRRKSILQSAVLTSFGKCAELMDAVSVQIKLDKSKYWSFITILRKQKSLLSAVYLLQESGLEKPDSTTFSTSSMSTSASLLERESRSDYSRQLDFAQLVASLILILEKEDGALARMKHTLNFFVLPDPKRFKGFTHVFPPQLYQSAETVTDLFDKLASRWRFFIDCRFLCLLVESSGCQEAVEKLKIFLSEWNKAVSVISIRELSEDYTLPHTSMDEHPACPASSPDPQLPVEATLPLATVRTQPAPEMVMVEVKLDAHGLTQKSYSEIACAVCRCLQLPGPSMCYCGTRRNCVITWEISASLVSYLLSIQVADRDVQDLSALGVKELTTGSFFHLFVPTMKYWEREIAAMENEGAEVTSSSHTGFPTYSTKPNNETGKGTATCSYPGSANSFQFEAAKYISKKINIHPSNYKETYSTRKEFQQGQESLRTLSTQTSKNQTPPREPEVIDTEDDQELKAADDLNIPPGPQWGMSTSRWSVAGKREVFLVASIGAPPNGIPDVVPLQGDGVLTDEDLQKLENQGIPRECCDDISIVRARVKRHPNIVSIREELSTTGWELTRDHILQQLGEFLNNVKEKGAAIHYIGHGRKGRGDWCFKDGFITFRDIMHLYSTTRIKGRVLTIINDCSYSGSWVQECCRYLDEQGITACGHAAAEKGMLLKVFTSCRPSETANVLAFSTHGMQNDKNTGTMLYFFEKELRKSQHTKVIDFTDLRCGHGPQDPCSYKSPKYTWMKTYQGDLIHIVRGRDKGRPAWYYVLLVEDNETICAFKEALKSPTINLENYGQILYSGFGEEPPNELRDEIEKQYGGVYK